MKRTLLAVLIVAFATCATRAQEQSGGKGQADRLFERYQYFEALQIYLNVSNSRPDDVTVTERIADCYRLLNKYEDAEKWYAQVVGKPGAKAVDNFYYAEALLRDQKFDEAKKAYRNYYNGGSDDQLKLKLATCDSAAAWMKRTSRYNVKAETKLNTNYSDWGVSYQGKTDLVFTSNRPTGDEVDNRTGNGWFRLFDYNLEKSVVSQLELDKSGKMDLSKDYHTGPIAFSPGGDTAYITVNTRVAGGRIKSDKTSGSGRVYTRRLQLIMASKKDGKWGNFKEFPYDNVNMFSDGYATLSKDGQILYFVSDRPGGQGKTDIWYCNKSGSDWGIPYNCGSVINTPGEEGFPFIGPDSKLYFASNGLPGMGGLDIFVAGGDHTTWSTPINLKYPINSTSDDFSFATRDGLSGYLSSNRQGGKGEDDIYSFTFSTEVPGTTLPPVAFQNPNKAATPIFPDAKTDVPADNTVQTDNPPVKTPVLAAPLNANAGVIGGNYPLEGTVYNENTGEPIDSVTVLLRTATGGVAFGTMSPDGHFSFKANRSMYYTLEVKKKGFYPATVTLSPKDMTKDISVPMKMNLRPLQVGATFVIRNIYYDLNLARIRKDAMVELDRLVDLMRENPSLKIELSSHTDSRGSDYYNMLLSQARAVSATNYITRRGISPTRIVAKGYGETRLLNKCANGVPCSEEDHQLNRRTEIKVLGMTK